MLCWRAYESDHRMSITRLQLDNIVPVHINDLFWRNATTSKPGVKLQRCKEFDMIALKLVYLLYGRPIEMVIAM